MIQSRRKPAVPVNGPRPLRDDERQLVKRQTSDSTWDEGVIAAFMGTPGVHGEVWEFHGHRLILYVADADKHVNHQVAATLRDILAWFSPPRRMTAIVWWRKDPRILSANEWPTRRQVNGGWTSAGANTICVYRAEEWDRVIFHEMIHALEWDWKMPARPLPCWGLPKGSQIMPTLFEAWTELLAEWLWCAWNNVPWAHQVAWSRTQAVQILTRRGHLWREDTSVFAYYVLKAALAPYMARLLTVGISDGVPEERDRILCELTSKEIAAMSHDAKHVEPVAMSLRMSAPLSHST